MPPKRTRYSKRLAIVSKTGNLCRPICVQQIQVGERKLTAEGKYISGTPYPKLRLEYRIRVGTMQGSLVEVCDGTILHTEKTIGRAGIKLPIDSSPVEMCSASWQPEILVEPVPVASQGAELGIGGFASHARVH